MLSSKRDGEIIASVRAIMRTLESEKLDIHALAEAVENGHAANGGGFSEREKQKILERSIEIGKRLAQGRREDGGGRRGTRLPVHVLPGPSGTETSGKPSLSRIWFGAPCTAASRQRSKRTG
jgi:hypothetical protein